MGMPNPAALRMALQLVLITAAACSPALQPGPGDAPGSETGAPKVLTIAIQREPQTFGTFVGSQGSAGPTTHVAQIVHNYLAIENERGVRQPQLAVDLPSVEKGTWRLNPDGSMDTTWRVRPNIKWHDGTPFTSADLLFSFTANRDPDLPRPIGRAARLMESATAPDAHTLIVHWATTYVRADEDAGLGPLASHLVEDLYRTDKQAFVNGPHFTTEFVGLGPYRLVTWEQSSHIELARFDDYFLGRPPLDKVIVRFVDDPNTMIANILAGAVDVVLPPGVGMQNAVEIKQRWEGTGNQVHVGLTAGLEQVEFQHRPEYARPTGGITNRLVRQGLFYAMDRAALVEVATHGFAPAADSWLRPDDPIRPEVESAIPQYPYDPSRAQQLLTQSGWTRGADGALVHAENRERFELEIRAREAASERGMNIIADQWKAVGVQSTLLVVPPSRRQDIEYEATRPGVLISNPRGDSLYGDRLHSRTLSSASTRWQGSNKAGYSNPRADDLFDQLSLTIATSQRAALQREALREVFDDLAIMPLFWEIQPILALGDVKARLGGTEPTWNIFEWDKVRPRDYDVGTSR